MHVCLFEDRPEQLAPLSLTRAVFDLRCGLSTLREKIVRILPAGPRSAWVRDELCETLRPEASGWSINDAEFLRPHATLWINGRWLPPAKASFGSKPCVAWVDDQIAYAIVPMERNRDFPGELPGGWLASLSSSLPHQEAGGAMIDFPWDLVDANGHEIEADWDQLSSRRCPSATSPTPILGPSDRLWIHPSARVEPMVLIDVTAGPVIIDEDAVVSAFTRLEGPCHVGSKTQVMAGKIRAGTSLGPQSRIGGEVEASIVHGHSNKYHDGFLGHAYVGEWVNLGAGTNNSDLRNDYGEVKVVMNGLPMRTGKTKVGCIIGDHTKTGLGTLLNTGASVGAFCQLLPSGGFAPKYLPCFSSWWNGSVQEAFTLEQLLLTAETVMKRRGKELTDARRTLYTHLYETTRNERQRVMRETEMQRLRRTA